MTRQNKQSIHQTMKKGWNRCPTQKTKVMEWMTPLKRWNGLAWVCMEWLWKGLARCGGEGSSGTTVFPQTQRVRLVSLCVGVTEPLPFLPSGQAMETRARAHKQTTCPGNHPRSTPPADVSRNVRHVLEDSSGDGYRRPGDQRR